MIRLPLLNVPTTRIVVSPVSTNVTVTGSPTPTPRLSAASVLTSIVPGSSASRLPLSTPRSITRARPAVSIAVTREPCPFTWAEDSRSSTTSLTSSRARSSFATEGLSPIPAPAGSRIRSERLPPLTASETELLSEVAVTATAATTVRPIVSARAVAAERRELRAMLRAANRQPPPRRPWSASRAAPRARVGPRTTRPANVVTVARTVHQRWLPMPAATASPARPPVVSAHPAIRRPRASPPPRGTTVRSASMGATRVAAHAGAIAATVVTSSPTASPATSVRVSTAGVVVGSSTPITSSRDRMPAARRDPEQQPEPAGHQPDHRGLDEDPGENLPAGGADRPEQGDLAAALRHQHVEGVPDDEGADQHRDAGEHQEHRGEDAHRVAHGGRAVGGHLLARQRLHAVRQHLGDPVTQRLRPGALRGQHVDLVDDPHLVEHPLRRGQVEPGEGGSQQAVGVAEPDDADQREAPATVLEHDVDRVAEGVVGGPGRARVQRELVRAGGRAARAEGRGPGQAAVRR